jgi:TatA/E family protein of Tat protein translocase
MFSLAFLDLNPVHIGFVLLLALLLFGPNKLPEMGQQLGRALRELKKAGSELTNSFNMDHEQENKPYDYGYPPYDDQSATYTEPAAIEAKTDLTDYTIVGQPVQDTASHNGSSDQVHEVAATSVAHTESTKIEAAESSAHKKEG